MKRTTIYIILISILSSFTISQGNKNVDIQKKNAGIINWLKKNNVIALDTKPLTKDDFLFDLLKTKTKIDLINGITQKYYIKAKKNTKKEHIYTISVYEYSTNSQAQKNKAIIDSLSKLNATQIDPFLVDMIHKTDIIYINIENNIVELPKKLAR